jgi:hypothetical protein
LALERIVTRMSGNEERARGIAARAKGRATLFEVLRDRESALRGTKHPPRRSEEPEPQVAAPPVDAAPLPKRVAEPPREAEPLSPAVAQGDGGASAPPLIELDDDRIRVSLTSVGCAFVVFVFAMSVFAGFKVGWHRGHDAGAVDGYELGRASYVAEVHGDIELARSERPATDVIGSLLEQAPAGGAPADAVGATGGSATAAEPPGGWIRDYTYIVVQEFLSGNESDAENARRHLAEFGIDAAITETDRGTTQLITTQGYNRNDPTQRQLADQMLSRIHELGAEYYASGGGYKLEGYFKTLKGDAW